MDVNNRICPRTKAFKTSFVVTVFLTVRHYAAPFLN